MHLGIRTGCWLVTEDCGPCRDEVIRLARQVRREEKYKKVAFTSLTN